MQAHAVAHLPSLDSQQARTISAHDAYGNPVTLKYRYWINNQSRMYLLEGTQAIQKEYNLKPGDVIQFSKRPDGSLVLHGRRGTPADLAKKPGRPPAGTIPAD